MRVLMILGLSLTGCIAANMSASARLQDAVVQLNDGLRWNRIDLALDQVDPSYRAQFVRTHRRWSRAFQIADTELLRVETGPHGGPVSVVAVRWYSEDSTILERAVVYQRWRRAGTEFLLLDEQVREGNRTLLATR